MDTLAGKLIRIDPLTGQGVPSNPFFDANDPNSYQSKIYATGLRWQSYVVLLFILEIRGE